jgi:hypothetical protein
MKDSGMQVNPHAPKEHCDSLVEQDLIHGCGKPFRLFFDSDNIVKYVDKYDYI